MRPVRGVLGHPDPLLAAGTAALVLLASVAAWFTGYLQAGQQPAARLACAPAIVLAAPVLTR